MKKNKKKYVKPRHGHRTYICADCGAKLGFVFARSTDVIVGEITDADLVVFCLTCKLGVHLPGV